MIKQTLKKPCRICKRTHYDNVGCIQKKEKKRNPLSNDYIRNDAEPDDWFTSRGRHIPIFKGQSKDEAFKKNYDPKKGGKKANQSKRRSRKKESKKLNYQKQKHKRKQKRNQIKTMG